MLRDVQADLLQNLAVAVAEGHAAGVGTAEHNVPAVGDLAHSGLLIENIQNAVARGEGALQPGARFASAMTGPKLLMSATTLTSAPSNPMAPA